MKPAVAASEESGSLPRRPSGKRKRGPVCQVFFSAYGLAPAQYKWLVENRRKEYSTVCPTLIIATVDYVILFARFQFLHLGHARDRSYRPERFFRFQPNDDRGCSRSFR